MSFITSVKRIWKMRIVKAILIFFLILLLIYSLRYPIFYGMGQFLIAEDDKVEQQVFVMGGNSFDRGNGAVRLWKDDKTRKFICVGGNIPKILEMMNINLTEGMLTYKIMVDQGVDESALQILEQGTSTYEEVEAIRDFCLDKKITAITIISDKFHLRRLRWVLNELLLPEGITCSLRGVSSSKYEESKWWNSEDGMLMVNNEYVKLCYYIIKH